MTQPVSYSRIYQVVKDYEDIHSTMMTDFFKLGGSIESWQRQDQMIMCNILTDIEDTLERRPGRPLPSIIELRAAIKTMRRELEWALWP